MAPPLYKYFLKNDSKTLIFSKEILASAKALIKSLITVFLFSLIESKKCKVC